MLEYALILEHMQQMSHFVWVKDKRNIFFTIVVASLCPTIVCFITDGV